MSGGTDQMGPGGCVQGCLWVIVIGGSAFAALVVVWVMFGALVMGLLNSLIYPGYETCKSNIRAQLREPGSAEFSWPPRTMEHRSNPDQWRYVFTVRAKNGFGGMNSSTMGCEVDDRGDSMRVMVEW